MVYWLAGVWLWLRRQPKFRAKIVVLSSSGNEYARVIEFRCSDRATAMKGLQEQFMPGERVEWIDEIT
jgi:hypothetical protein